MLVRGWARAAAFYTQHLAQQVETLLRRTAQHSPRNCLQGSLGRPQARVGKASELINEHLGALTHVEGNGGISIRGAGCPLSALTGKHPGVCLAIETFVSEIVGVPVRECCDRDNRPRCCFEIEVEHARRST
jgi:predicted ArsR family transcriptional regulator